jgi:hypothetical protein
MAHDGLEEAYQLAQSRRTGFPARPCRPLPRSLDSLERLSYNPHPEQPRKAVLQPAQDSPDRVGYQSGTLKHSCGTGFLARPQKKKKKKNRHPDSRPPGQPRKSALQPPPRKSLEWLYDLRVRGSAGGANPVNLPSPEVEALILGFTLPLGPQHHRPLTACAKGLACEKKVAMPLVAVPRVLRERFGEKGPEDLARLLSSRRMVAGKMSAHPALPVRAWGLGGHSLRLGEPGLTRAPANPANVSKLCKKKDFAGL